MTFLDDDDQPAPRGRLRRRWWVYVTLAVVVAVAVIVPLAAGDDDEPAPSGTASAGDRSGPWRPGSGDLVHGTGTSRDGSRCAEGVRQVPATGYSVPCLPAFRGDNGGATAQGVTADAIRIAVRRFPATANAQGFEQAGSEAGFASAEDVDRIVGQWVDYFNEHFETYGREVELVDFESEYGDPTQEAIGGGREAACADATKIAQELHAFGVITQPVLVGDLTSSFGPFSECAAQQGLVVFDAAPYYAESYYDDHHPYLWHLAMDCERLGYELADYAVERLVGGRAAYAKGDLGGKPRVFGSYLADDPQYNKCGGRALELIQEASADLDLPDAALSDDNIVNYQLDFARFAEQAQRAVVQYKRRGVTTVFLACDPVSIGFLTQAARQQDYFPEWVIIGVAAQDTDNFGRTYDQEVVEGSLFGFSQLGSNDKLFGSSSEPGRLYREAFGRSLPRNTNGWFFSLVNMFDLVQAAGPTLSAENIAAGVATLPDLGAPGYAYGRWSYATDPDGSSGSDHTALDDAREVYWDGDEVSPVDGEEGTWVETLGGKRFTPGDWPKGAPELFGESAPG
ncbi:MAG TPA: hypothetical protein VFW63_08370 [Acidimicrobiales bacterium]|nr:hypothetical protein [Acidimicrobiales bacterium]